MLKTGIFELCIVDRVHAHDWLIAYDAMMEIPHR
jgi:hypothetical protein